MTAADSLFQRHGPVFHPGRSRAMANKPMHFRHENVCSGVCPPPRIRSSSKALHQLEWPCF
jgi:hypothetical protein